MSRTVTQGSRPGLNSYTNLDITFPIRNDCTLIAIAIKNLAQGGSPG
jgi:hypothetical protein